MGPRVFRIVLQQGMNRQIRRMCAAFGYEVVGSCSACASCTFASTSCRSASARNLTQREIDGLMGGPRKKHAPRPSAPAPAAAHKPHAPHAKGSRAPRPHAKPRGRHDRQRTRSGAQ